MAYEYTISRSGLGTIYGFQTHSAPQAESEDTGRVIGSSVIPGLRTIGGKLQTQAAIDAVACGGVACPDGGERVPVRQDPDDYMVFANAERQMRERDCSIQCTEGGVFYYCCPPEAEAEEVAGGSNFVRIIPTLSVTHQLFQEPEGEAATTAAVITEENGFPWLTVGILGLLGLGAAGFAGYWFWWRERE